MLIFVRAIKNNLHICFIKSDLSPLKWVSMSGKCQCLFVFKNRIFTYEYSNELKFIKSISTFMSAISIV